MTISAALRNSRKRRKVAQNLLYFKALIASPTDVGTDTLDPLTWPAGARLAVSYDTAFATGHVFYEINGRVFNVEGALGDEVVKLEYVELGEVIQFTNDAGIPAGALTVYVLNEWQDQPRAVATGEFT